MFSLGSLDHIVLRVSDIDRCVDFYESVLGCVVEMAHTEIGLYQLRAGDFIIDLLEAAGPIGAEGGAQPGPTGHNVDHFCIRIKPFDEAALREHFSGHGVEAGPLLNNWGGDGRGPSMYIADPAGNRVDVKGPPTHPYDPAVGFIPDPQVEG